MSFDKDLFKQKQVEDIQNPVKPLSKEKFKTIDTDDWNNFVNKAKDKVSKDFHQMAPETVLTVDADWWPKDKLGLKYSPFVICKKLEKALGLVCNPTQTSIIVIYKRKVIMDWAQFLQAAGLALILDALVLCAILAVGLFLANQMPHSFLQVNIFTIPWIGLIGRTLKWAGIPITIIGFVAFYSVIKKILW